MPGGSRRLRMLNQSVSMCDVLLCQRALNGQT